MLALRKRSLGLSLAGAALIALSPSAPARADTVTDWNAHAVNALVVTAGQSPTVSTVHLAMVHGAVYDAVNSIDERYEPYVVTVRARHWYSQDAAAATAAYRVLLALVPGQQPTLGPLYDASLASIPAGEAKEGGIRIGEIAAAAMLAARTGDGRFGAYRFPAPATPQDRGRSASGGRCRRASATTLAWIKDVRPFLIRDPARYAQRRPGRADQQALHARVQRGQGDRLVDVDDAHRGSDRPGALLGRGTAALDPRRPPARDRSRPRHGRDRADVRDALHDRRGRPDQHLGRQGALAVLAPDHRDPRGRLRRQSRHRRRGDWVPLINTPPYPDQPSGLSAVSAAMAESLTSVFGHRVRFSVTSVSSNTTRSYRSFSHAVDEVVDARVYSGIHFRKADERRRGARARTSPATVSGGTSSATDPPPRRPGRPYAGRPERGVMLWR